MVLGMVFIGGLTRLTGSGLSIVEWKPLTGILPPLTPTEWIREFSKYQQSPEFQKINFGMTLADFQSIFFLEYLHRLWGRLIGIVLLVPTLLMIFKKQHRELWLFLALLWILGLAQGVMGWVMVKSGLIHDPHVSPYRLSAHLFLGFMIFGITLWMTLLLYKDRLSNSQLPQDDCHPEFIPQLSKVGKSNKSSSLRAQRSNPGKLENPLNNIYKFFSRLLRPALSRARNDDGESNKVLIRCSLFALFLVVLTALFGAFVANLKAGLVYNTFPMMGESLIPREFLTQFPWWRDLFENPVSAQFIHRCLAILTAVFCGGLWVFQRRLVLSPSLTLAFNGMLIAVLVQVSLGILTLLLAGPLLLALLHQSVAFLVFGSLVYTLFLLYNKVFLE